MISNVSKYNWIKSHTASDHVSIYSVPAHVCVKELPLKLLVPEGEEKP